MEHHYIEEHHIADRYVTGDLDPAEAELFEDHYLSCPECLDRLELAEAMKRSFARVAEEEGAERSAAGQLAVVAWLYRLGRRRQLAALTPALLVLVFLPAGLALRGSATRDLELARARAASTAALAQLRSDLAARERDLTAERARTQLARAQEPQSNPPIVYLDPVRGAGGAAGGPTSRLQQPKNGSWIVLSWALDPPLYPTYLIVLENREGQKLWREAVPASGQTMSLLVPVNFVPPGDYTLLVSGQAPGGQLAAAGRFPFRILPPA